MLPGGGAPDGLSSVHIHPTARGQLPCRPRSDLWFKRLEARRVLGEASATPPGDQSSVVFRSPSWKNPFGGQCCGWSSCRGESLQSARIQGSRLCEPLAVCPRPCNPGGWGRSACICCRLLSRQQFSGRRRGAKGDRKGDVRTSEGPLRQRRPVAGPCRGSTHSLAAARLPGTPARGQVSASSTCAPRVEPTGPAGGGAPGGPTVSRASALRCVHEVSILVLAAPSAAAPVRPLPLQPL